MFDNTDRQWERFGDTDPYFGVLTRECFKARNMTEDTHHLFFESGKGHIEEVLATVRQHIAPAFAMDSALDFGCGVGRLVVPLSSHFKQVTGVDVSPAMIREAQKNCRTFGVRNATFVLSDDRLSLVRGDFDFIHAFIVFQHIPARRGRRMFNHLLAHLKSGGIGAFHFTYGPIAPWMKFFIFLKSYVPFARILANILRGRPADSPHMRMNAYDLNRLVCDIQRLGVQKTHLALTDHDGFLGAMLYFRKP